MLSEWGLSWRDICEQRKPPKMFHYGGLLLSPELLVKRLGLPPDSVIHGAEWDMGARCLRLYVENSQMPEYIEGAPAQFIPFTVSDDDTSHD